MILQADAARLLVIGPGDQEPHTITLAEFGASHVPDVLLVTKRETGAAAEPGDDGATPLGAQKFSFKWFVPHLLKHKKLWRDIIIGSMFIQLIALAMPLFTQVTIDKVPDAARRAWRGAFGWAAAADSDCAGVAQAAEDFDL